MSSALALQNTAIMPVMSTVEAAQRRQAIVEFTKAIMVKGTDYGIIPGTGNKPTLLKPGAEKLTTLFGLSPRFELVNVTEDWTGDNHANEPFFNYQYRCSLYRGDLLVGQGEGSCNSWEKKYRYRGIVEWEATEDDKERAIDVVQIKKRNGGTFNKYIVPNPNPADVVNTLQKMAQKRALVAATLIAVNASEFFTQDVEDMDFGVIEGVIVEETTTTSPPPQKQPNGDSRGTTSPPEQAKRNPRNKPVEKDWRSTALAARKFNTFYTAAYQVVRDSYNDPEHVKAALEQAPDFEYDPANNAEYIEYLEKRKEAS